MQKQLILYCLFCFTCFASRCFATIFYASPIGNSANNGSFGNPWNLQFALNQPNSIVKPGDTLWLRGGTYTGSFSCNLNGTAAKPIIITTYPNERAVLQPLPQIGQNTIVLEIVGISCWLMNLEISGTATNRISTQNTIPPTDIFTCDGMAVHGENAKIINCIVHDCAGTGIGFWSDALNAEMYGCIIFNNGFANTSRGHGPGIYVQNSDVLKPKAILNNFIYNGFSIGIQHFASADVLKAVTIDSNTIFNSGALTNATMARRANLLVGGDPGGVGARAQKFKVRNNVFYRDTTDNTLANFMSVSDYRKNVELGFQDESLYDIDIDFSRNHVFGDPTPILLHKWDSGIFKQNTVYAYKNNYTGNRQLIEQEYDAPPFSNWDSNYYHTNQPSYTTPFGFKSFSNWQQTYLVDAHSTFASNGPLANAYFVRKNKFEPYKYYVTILNYEGADTVLLPAIPEISNGTAFAIFDVQQSYRLPIFTGFYNAASTALPMKTNTVAPALGMVPAAAKHTGKTLGIFIVVFYPEMYTISSGNWHNPFIWNTQKVPDYYHTVVVNHPITIAQNAWAKSIKSTVGGNVTISQNVLVNIGKQ